MVFTLWLQTNPAVLIIFQSTAGKTETILLTEVTLKSVYQFSVERI